jgi:transcriptional regulator with XRE-family HTH domain
MDRHTFLHLARDETGLTERQAEALYRRQMGEGRQEAAEAMGISPSNLDNAEREAVETINSAANTVAIAEKIGATPDDIMEVGVCPHCEEPTTSLVPDPTEEGPIQHRSMICTDCADGHDH